MSLDISPERVCYVHCNFCNTILAVSVPCSTMPTVVTVRCGHCASLLTVNMGALLQSLPPHHHQDHLQKQKCIYEEGGGGGGGKDSSSTGSGSGSSSSINPNKFPPLFHSAANLQQQPRMPLPPIPPPEKRQRVPSAYNRFIKEEIQRIKANNPDISHREAFSTAAKNWAHFPHIHFGLKLDANKQVHQLEQAVAGEGAQKSHGFY